MENNIALLNENLTSKITCVNERSYLKIAVHKLIKMSNIPGISILTMIMLFLKQLLY